MLGRKGLGENFAEGLKDYGCIAQSHGNTQLRDRGRRAKAQCLVHGQHVSFYLWETVKRSEQEPTS